MTSVELLEDDLEDVGGQLAAGRNLVPDHLWQGIVNHVIEGGDTGNFLNAVFANDLLNAATGADEVSLARLPDLMRFMHNCAPAAAWGSPEIRDSWRRLGGIKGCAHRDEVHAALCVSNLR